jgi:hypothetical protein
MRREKREGENKRLPMGLLSHRALIVASTACMFVCKPDIHKKRPKNNFDLQSTLFSVCLAVIQNHISIKKTFFFALMHKINKLERFPNKVIKG